MNPSHRIIAVGVLALAAFEAGADAPVLRLQGAVRIDGLLDEPGWAAAAWQSDFVRADASGEGAFQRAEPQTRFKTLFDDEALYVAIVCDEPNPAGRIARYSEHDRDVFTDDCVEIFLDPAGEGRYYQHFAINSKGAWCDDSAADYGLVRSKLWNFPLQTGAAADPAGGTWTVEVRIPFAALPFAVPPTESWLWNVTRNRRAGGGSELSSWSPLRGSFHSPKQFRRLTGIRADFRRFHAGIGEPSVVLAGDASGFHRLELKSVVANRSADRQTLTLAASVFGSPTGTVSKPFTLEPGASAEIAVPPLRVRADSKNASILLTVADAVSGSSVRAAVKRLDTELRPVAVTLLEPVYRGNIYATETVSNLVFRVALSPDMAAAAQILDFALLDEKGGARAASFASPEATSGPHSMDVSELPVGTYRLRVRAVGPEGQDLAQSETVIRKLAPAPGVEVRVDAKRNLLVNGKPVVLLGWYGTVDTEDPRKDVVALQNVQTPVVCEGLDLTKIREAWAKGIYSFICVQPGTMNYTFRWYRDPALLGLSEEVKTKDRPSEQYLSYLRQVVEAVRNEPGVLGYYLSDEPEINDHRSDYLEALYAILQELDPYRPVMITNDTLDGIVTHGYRACDILNPDPYSPELEYVPSFLKRVLEVAPTGKATMLTPWTSSNQAHMNHAWGSAPPYSYRVLRNQALVSVCLQSRGLSGYTSAFFRPEPVLRYGLPHIWRELRLLEPAMADPQAAPEADGPMETWLGRANGHLYLLAVSLRPGTRTVTLRHPLLAGVESLYNAATGRETPVRDGALTDTFAEGDAFLYTTDPAGRALATAEQAEAEVAARKAETMKPGNLFHVDHGARAASSPGFFAPWFTQYYFYAINGVTDDIGWQLTHAPLPGWLEISLPREERIGRVVVHTPNLKDFDLQWTASDGSRAVAEVRGNDRSIVEVRFPAAVPVLKMRLLALAAREGAASDRAQVTEIEAYTEPGEGPVTAIRKLASGAAGGDWTPLPGEAGPNPTLWREDFSGFFDAVGDDIWKMQPGEVIAEPAPGGGLALASASTNGYTSLSRSFLAGKEHRYLQVHLRDLEPRGYRWVALNALPRDGASSRQAMHTMLPGIYTADLHALDPAFRSGAAERIKILLSLTGGTRAEDGSVTPGARSTYEWLQLVRRPVNGLAVTLGDGAPLPDSLKTGDTLMFRLFLEQPAADATVEALADHAYSTIPLSGEPYVQLYKVGAKDGRAWGARVTLGPGTGKANGSKGYPILFRARITGGAISNTMMNAAIRFE
jgi:hypothetical protein